MARRGSCESESLVAGQENIGKNGDAPAQQQKLKQGMFPDVKKMKKEIRKNMKKPRYDVSNYYHKTGFCQQVARAQLFENITLAVISFNALWISIDTDYNNSDTLLDAHPVFFLAENFFCAYFTFEWIMRFGAFENKLNCLKDAWFVFDTFMVTMMVAETWVMTIFLVIDGGGGSMGNAGTIRLLRLLRLSRMARMARLLRSMPELLILIKGMVAAVRSVFFTLLLLVILTYVFAVFFRQTTQDTELESEYFPTVVISMHNLLLYGVLLDDVGSCVRAIAKVDSGVYALLISWYVYVLLASATIMNMLIGVLCEVITAVATTESEEMTIVYVRDKLEEIVKRVDFSKDISKGDATKESPESGGNTTPAVAGAASLRSSVSGAFNNEYDITKEGVLVMFHLEETAALFEEIDVDVIVLLDLIDTIFTDEDGREKKLEFCDFLEVLLDHRNSKSATVKDLTELDKFCHTKLDKMKELIDDIERKDQENRLRMEADVAILAEMIEKVTNNSTYEEQFKKIEDELMADIRARKKAEAAKVEEEARRREQLLADVKERRASMDAGLPPPNLGALQDEAAKEVPQEPKAEYNEGAGEGEGEADNAGGGGETDTAGGEADAGGTEKEDAINTASTASSITTPKTEGSPKAKSKSKKQPKKKSGSETAE
eukprot:TRINITY_DN26706_c0_g5_i1.p1 TRINITY_DN26706_c0_g5~~TRINITY_DN26706_c0_g5_i1.p1  ORF type:complete len:661 (-),score=212.09 TRINITY_DN26706_c0_g5_i1:72-2054(-)